MSQPQSPKVTRRGMLRAGILMAGLGVLPLLQACAGQQATPTVAPAPTQPAPTPTQAAAPTSAATAAATTTAATPTAAGAANATPTTASQAAPAAIDVKSIKINGKLSILQEKDYNPIHNDNLNKEVRQFAASNNWDLDLSYMEAFVGGGDFYQKMAAAVASNTQPDMMFGTKDAFILWYNKLAQPVDDVVAWARSQFGDPIKGLELASVIEGKWWAVPFFTRVGGFWARKSWYDEIGFDITANHDLQEWADASMKVTDPAKKRWGWGLTVNKSGDGETNVYTPVFEAGARYTDETGEKVVFESDEAIQAFTWLKDIYSGDKYAKMRPPGLDSWTDTSNNEKWIAGTIGFTSNAGTLFAQAVKQVPDIGKDTYLVPQPIGPVGKKQQLTSAGGATFNLFAGAKNPDAAKAVMEHLLDKSIQKQIWSTSAGYACPAYKWGWDEPEIVNGPNNVPKTFEKIAYGEQFFAWMPGPQPRLWINAISNAVVLTSTMAKILTGTPIKDAVHQAQLQIQQLHDQYQGK
ncbi:MAG: hypothetical protein IRY83_11915 [Chloroflexi bacterium]|nr:hypothetical protein [Chloroflexota bacterium]